MRSMFAATVAMGLLLAQAEAATFTVEDVVQTPKLATQFPFPATSLTISDTAVQRGSFLLQEDTLSAYAGNISDFGSFTFGQEIITATGGGPFYDLSIDLKFSATGLIKSAFLAFSGFSPGFMLSGNGSALTGNYYPFDSASCLGGPASDCDITANFVQTTNVSSSIPEPGTFLLLGAGMLCLALSKLGSHDRRQITTPRHAARK